MVVIVPVEWMLCKNQIQGFALPAYVPSKVRHLLLIDIDRGIMDVNGLNTEPEKRNIPSLDVQQQLDLRKEFQVVLNGMAPQDHPEMYVTAPISFRSPLVAWCYP